MSFEYGGNRRLSKEEKRERLPRPLTLAQRRVMVAICGHIAEYGYPPTLKELLVALQLTSTNGIHQHLRFIEKKGYLRIDAMKSRGIVVLFAVVESPAPIAGKTLDAPGVE